MRENKRLKIALAGNPNCGKTTLFNELTGSNQYVGNWPGVTVSKKIGITRSAKSELCDLPGVYSLSPYSMEEIVTRDYLIKENPDAIINILDGVNLERNLYLTLELLELEKPMVLAVNMMDDLKKKGWKLNCSLLSELLHIPVIPIVARTGYQCDLLLQRAEELGKERCQISSPLQYPYHTQKALEQMKRILHDRKPACFYASRLLSGDSLAQRECQLSKDEMERISKIAEAYEQTSQYGDRETILADVYYQEIEKISLLCLKKTKQNQKSLSDKIDEIITGRFSALPIFFLLMFLIFTVTFGPIGRGLSNLMEHFFSHFVYSFCKTILEAANSPAWCYHLLLDAVLGGISGVLIFLPQISLLFFFLSILEDSGYMARAAFIMDSIFRKIGLSGKSFIPMLMGFGCTTPAVMAARSLNTQRERELTMIVTPFMSCGARFPIYALFAGIFFTEHQGIAVFSMYLLGIVVAVLSGLVLKKLYYREDSSPFILELPPYRMPSAKTVFLHVWEKTKGFLLKAGTVIFAMSVVLWVLEYFTPGFVFTENPADSILGKLGSMIAPVFSPLGFGFWQAAVAILTGLVAKESVVSTLTVLYAGGNAALLPVFLSAHFDMASALAFMAFCLLYMPCISAFITLCRELGSLKKGIFAAGYQSAVAYLVSFFIYQAGKLLFKEQTVRDISSSLLIQQEIPVGQSSSIGAFLCSMILALGVVLFISYIIRFMRGKCCERCANCRMLGSCKGKEK